MTSPPTAPKVYHITHVDNLAGIVTHGLLSDTTILRRGDPTAAVGMSKIKARRLRLPVVGHVGLMVGACVPFYFCPRSVMLFVLHRGNHPELGYSGGQAPLVHLEVDLFDAIGWAEAQGRRWAFSLGNAGARYAEFRSTLAALGDLRWDAIGATDFREPAIKEGKQAEFLVEGDLPWSLVERVGVLNRATLGRASAALTSVSHKPALQILPKWYY